MSRRLTDLTRRFASLRPGGRRAVSGPIERYLAGGQIPWSEGYTDFRRRAINTAIADADIMERFQYGRELPPQYGRRLDERIVEYPWTLSRLADGPLRLLDAGATLNHVPILRHPRLADKRLLFVALAPTHVEVRETISYLYDDVRELILRDDVFDAVTCISTLEHIGLDNTQLYVDDARYAEHDLTGYAPALVTFRRVLKPGGRLLLTVPFGRAEDHGWLQQFNHAGIQQIVAEFGGAVACEAYYRYAPDGWQVATAESSADARYYDIHADPTPQPDGAGAARAVCCLELIRP